MFETATWTWSTVHVHLSFTAPSPKDNFTLLPVGRLWGIEWRHGSGCPGGPVIAADVRWPHQKSSLLGPAFPARHRLRLFFCSSHSAGEGLWWLSLLPPTLPGCSAGGHIEDRGRWEREGGRAKRFRLSDLFEFRYNPKGAMRPTKGACVLLLPVHQCVSKGLFLEAWSNWFNSADGKKSLWRCQLLLSHSPFFYI